MRLDAGSLDQRCVGGDLLLNEPIELGLVSSPSEQRQVRRASPAASASNALTASSCSFSMMARGVFAGRNIPIQNGHSASVKPASEVVGTSGSAAERLALFTTSAVSLPSFTNGKAFATGGKKKSISTCDDLADYFRPTLEWHVRPARRRCTGIAWR